jgi:hypothetical protein
MDRSGQQPTILFAGDLNDPWVLRILDSIAGLGQVQTLLVDGAMTARPFDPDGPPELVVVHRARLTQGDAASLMAWRPDSRLNPLPRIILCHSPYVRHAELELAAAWADAVIPEAAALEGLPRQASLLLRSAPPRFGGNRQSLARVEVISTDHEMREMLAEACTAAGFLPTPRADLDPRAERLDPASDSSATDGPVITIWDVPVLDPDWPGRLDRLGRRGPVVALLGFADRSIVRLAREKGASACLDLPLDLDDLREILGRLVRDLPPVPASGLPIRAEEAHPVPPPPAGRTAPRGRAAIRERAGSPPSWPEGQARPRMNVETGD